MPDISVVINCDTRPERSNENGLSKGVVSRDFLTDGVFNKIKFFSGFDIEVILFIDKIEEIPQQTLEYIHILCDVVVVRKHTDEPLFNDMNYISAMGLARGKYIAKFDQDTACFTSSKEPIEKMMEWLETYDYVSYPSWWSPNPVSDESFDHWWSSTRFFMCKKETIDFTELRWMMQDYDRCYKKYPANRKCFWTEHWLGMLAKYKGKGVFYPPINIENYTIFSWGSYEQYTLRRLNEFPYSEIVNFINSKGGIQYPVDIFC